VTQYYQVTATQLSEQILPAGFPKTQVFGYGGYTKDAVTGKSLGFIANSPGPTFNAIKGIPINVEYTNNIHNSEFLAVDPTIMWANPNGMTKPAAPFLPFPTGYAQAQSPVPISTHLHGGEVQSTSDGGPNAWNTANGIHGPDYSSYLPAPANAAWDHYPNTQQAATLWYHDHAMGLTRINVYSGMAGFYLLQDPTDNVEKLLPTGKYDVPLAIQDRDFYSDGSLDFPVANNLTGDHPYWIPEFFGNTIMVNGLVWPNMNVDQGEYRFRMLDGSNARFYNLSFEVQGTGQTAAVQDDRN
jgi:FtsP/CotA-like multicopper oxidase with cupredoxin domain